MSRRRLVLLSAGLAAIASTVYAAGTGYHIVDRLAGPDGAWDYASYDASHNRVFVAQGGSISAFDLKTHTTNPTFATAVRAHAALAVNGGAEVMITNGGDNTVTFVDGATGALIATVPTGKGPDAATPDPVSGLVLVMNHQGGDITLVDPKTHTVAGAIAVGGTLEAAAVDGKGHAFVNVEDQNQIAVVDIATRQVTRRYAMAGCDGPTGIAYADGLLIASCDGVAEVVRASDGKGVRQIKTGGGADGVAYDPKRKLAFVSCGANGALAVIAVAHGDARLVDTVVTQRGARTLAVDSASGRVFLPAARYGAAATDGGRPTLIRGSFELLVVGK